MFGVLVLYLESITLFQKEPYPCMYLFIQYPIKQILKSWRVGMPIRPNAFFIQIEGQVSNTIFLQYVLHAYPILPVVLLAYVAK